MMRILSKEEVKQEHEAVDKWIMALDYNTKFHLRSLLEPFQKQSNCSHIFIDPNSYENQMPKDKLFCRLCSVTKEIE
jgi:hypothetical protein